MAPTHTELSRLVIEEEDQLKAIFDSKSPIPGFVYYGLLPTAKVSLINAKFEMSILDRVAENLENFALNKRENTYGSKEQTLFVILHSEKTFKYDFEYKPIGEVIADYVDIYKETDIKKIVIVTKYFWHDPQSNIVQKQYVSILVFDT